MLTNLLVLIPELCECASKGENKLGPFIPGCHPSSREKAVDTNKQAPSAFHSRERISSTHGTEGKWAKVPWGIFSLELSLPGITFVSVEISLPGTYTSEEGKLHGMFISWESNKD